MGESPYDYHDDGRGLLTDSLDACYRDVLVGVMRNGLGVGSNGFLAEKYERALYLTGLWEMEAESRAFNEGHVVTQFEYSCATSAIMFFGDHVGVGSSAIWAYFCAVTQNPTAFHDEQLAVTHYENPELADKYFLAHGEIKRILAAAPRDADAATPASPIVFGERFAPPECVYCGSGDTHVASSPTKFRRIHCRKCNAYWKVAK